GCDLRRGRQPGAATQPSRELGPATPAGLEFVETPPRQGKRGNQTLRGRPRYTNARRDPQRLILWELCNAVAVRHHIRRPTPSIEIIRRRSALHASPPLLATKSATDPPHHLRTLATVLYRGPTLEKTVSENTQETGGVDVQRLSKEDQQHLDRLEEKLQKVRDRVIGVVNHFSTAFFLDGPGGVSKSYTVFQELRRLRANYRVSNSRLTGHGLIDTLETYPESVHVIEDVVHLMNDKMALGVLLSPL